MALKLIQQDVSTLRAAFDERKVEYDALRAAGRWAGAILLAGTLLELALKLIICKHLRIAKLPHIFQVHDLELLLYCSGQYDRLASDNQLLENFSYICDHWSMALRYEGAVQTQQTADAFDHALFDPSHGILASLSQHF